MILSCDMTEFIASYLSSHIAVFLNYSLPFGLRKKIGKCREDIIYMCDLIVVRTHFIVKT